MNFEEMKAIMGDGASDEAVNAALAKVQESTKAAIAAETKGLVENKTKILTQMERLKKNQIPEGFDLNEYNTFLSDKEKLEQEKKALEEQKLEGKGEWEALKLKLNENHTTTINTLKNETSAQISSLRKALDKELIENSAIKAIEAEKGNSFFLLPHVLSQMTTVEVDGRYEVQVLDSEGNQRLKEDATTPFKAKDLVAEMKANDQFSLAFQDLNSGSRTDVNANGKGASGTNPWKKESRNVTEQARITRENPVLAEQYKKAAGV